MGIDKKEGARLGWREWVALPALGIPAIKAKIDTGARTSALHAFSIQRLSRGGRQWVRFGVHPVQRRSDVALACSAEIVDERWVTDSGGHRERRIVIRTPLAVAGREFPIEVTLANRDSMSFRFLLGRTALEDFLIAPGASYLTGIPALPY